MTTLEQSNEKFSMNTRFFMAKCISMDSLKRAYHTGIWACNDRNAPPQPKEYLTEAVQSGPVILIFSVNNCRGYHGYASMETTPGSVIEESPVADLTSANNETEKSLEPDISSVNNKMEKMVWHRFSINWKTIFLKDHSEQCLPSSKTEHLNILDAIGNTISINLARNYQEIPHKQGSLLCDMITDHYEHITSLKLKKHEEKLAKLPSPFYTPKAGTENNPHELWKNLLQKVEKMGTVLLACAFGSQRYNLDTPESDIDMCVVYAADTKDILLFDPPQHTFKNRDTESCDYTVLEVHRYCELLLGGDPKIVETFFLHPSAIYFESAEWGNLRKNKNLFLSNQCMEKFMRDAQGAKGLKLMEKWVKSGIALEQPMEKKVCKLFYIIIRLLQNARDIVADGDLKVYRSKETPQWEFLHKTRQGKMTYDELKCATDQLIEEISVLKGGRQFTHESEAKLVTEKWLLDIRYKNLKKLMERS